MLVYGLLVYLVAREVVFWWQTNKLINKCMSKDFHEYRRAQTYGKMEKTAIRVPVEDYQDVNPLQGII